MDKNTKTNALSCLKISSCYEPDYPSMSVEEPIDWLIRNYVIHDIKIENVKLTFEKLLKKMTENGIYSDTYEIIINDVCGYIINDLWARGINHDVYEQSAKFHKSVEQYFDIWNDIACTLKFKKLTISKDNISCYREDDEHFSYSYTIKLMDKLSEETFDNEECCC